MEKQCSHGVEWDVHCAECEMVSLDETIFHAGKALALAKATKIEVQALINAQREALSDASWPDHLKRDAPYAQCDQCRRKSWTSKQFGSICGMVDLDRNRTCPGRLIKTVQ